MIFLIDDKSIRQENFGWNAHRIETFKDLIIPIYNIQDVEKYREEIFDINNLILFHESFFDNPANNKLADSNTIKQDLIDFTRIKGNRVVFFSGSISSRYIDDVIASLPVHILYNNLEVFLVSYKTDKKQTNLKILAFGKEFENELLLDLKREIWSLIYKYDDNSPFMLTPKLDELVRKYETTVGKKLTTSNITNGYFKYMINKQL